ncbi:hypothetical protein IRY44_18815 [Micromonospora sp. ANENR4]|uniref:hypothetical protein n=1 Tax=unclassified Micromonospora TaxID=2617518 RepID=UPI00188F5CE0|nr:MULTISPECIES: hypothetical protein [unclassified Micromonospora]MBF5031801.1 hypothetical protein [Micromonospora sp. ANENR4]MCZ7475235.1 hypothetical protein [Micromonospora sp. WMMC273]
MRSRRLVLPLIIAALVSAVGWAPSPAYAYPVTPFSASLSGGLTEGGVTWYNRSVGLQGYVSDHTPGSTTAVFEFRQGEKLDSAVLLSTQTRTASGYGENRTDFNFTQEGPVGGITWVVISLCTDKCQIVRTLKRP